MATINIEEDYAWEIKYDEESKPFYYNRLTDRFLLCRPNCLESAGRVNISEPVIEAYYKGLWFKGILLGPADRVRFAVQLEQGPVRLLDAERNGIRKWTSMRRHTIPSSAQRGSLESIPTSDSKEAFLDMEDDESLSKLSDTSSQNSREEKFNFESIEEKERQSKTQDKVSNTEMFSESRRRSKSWGGRASQGALHNDFSGDEDDADWMNTMLPLQTSLKGEGTGRKQRHNAVLLDLRDLKTIKKTI